MVLQMSHSSGYLNTLSTTFIISDIFNNSQNTFLSKYRCDVTKEDDWEKIWSHAEDTFGDKVQILVNNAGVNPVRGWKMCMDIMIYGVMIGSFMARDKMGKTKVEIIYEPALQGFFEPTFSI